ncbi:MAG: hypothetical protein ACFFDN_20835 [Candidatus Hodarchaeota archaeon]
MKVFVFQFELNRILFSFILTLIIYFGYWHIFGERMDLRSLFRLLKKKLKGSARGTGAEIASILNSVLVIVVIFALISALSQNWGVFFAWILVGSVLIMFSKFFQRI